VPSCRGISGLVIFDLAAGSSTDYRDEVGRSLGAASTTSIVGRHYCRESGISPSDSVHRASPGILRSVTSKASGKQPLDLSETSNRACTRPVAATLKRTRNALRAMGRFAVRLDVANLHLMLSSECSQIGTGSSNSPRSANESPISWADSLNMQKIADVRGRYAFHRYRRILMYLIHGWQVRSSLCARRIRCRCPSY
jgi:hypothetical protein